MTDATFEGANLSSLLPHLDSESTFNQRSSQSLHRRGAAPEAFYEGSSGAHTLRGCVQGRSLQSHCRMLLASRYGTAGWTGGVQAGLVEIGWHTDLLSLLPVDFRRSNTMPSSHRRSSATQRAALPFEWRKSMAQKGDASNQSSHCCACGANELTFV